MWTMDNFFLFVKKGLAGYFSFPECYRISRKGCTILEKRPNRKLNTENRTYVHPGSGREPSQQIFFPA